MREEAGESRAMKQAGSAGDCETVWGKGRMLAHSRTTASSRTWLKEGRCSHATERSLVKEREMGCVWVSPLLRKRCTSSFDLAVGKGRARERKLTFLFAVQGHWRLPRRVGSRRRRRVGHLSNDLLLTACLRKRQRRVGGMVRVGRGDDDQGEGLQVSLKGGKDSKDFDSHELSMVEPVVEMGDRRWDGSNKVVDRDDDEGGGCRVSALREDQTGQTPELFPRPSFLGPQRAVYSALVFF